MRSFMRRLGGPLAGAAAAIVTIAAANAFAGSGIGDVFNLGQSNTVDAQSQLTGNAGGNPQLRVENASINSGASGVLGKMSSTSAAADSSGLRGLTASTNPAAAAVAGKNTGGGPAFSADVKPGAPPLAVNSSALVVNLNADELDGEDASALDPNEVFTIASPWNLRSFSSGTEIAIAQGPKTTVTATTSALPKTIVVPFEAPRFLYIAARALRAEVLRVCYQVSNSQTTIKSTALIASESGNSHVVFSGSAPQNSTTPTCYAVHAQTPISFLGSAYLRLSVTFGATGQSLTLYSPQLGYRLQ